MLRVQDLLARGSVRFDSVMRSQARGLARLLVLSVILVACGGARTRMPQAEQPIDALRKAAQKAPQDAALWSERAIAEHLQDGGDPEQARAALEHAKKLGAKGLKLGFIEAEEHVLE